MSRRTQTEWIQLFELHKQSGLTATAFCKEHQINPKYFSLRKQQLTNEASPFVQAITQTCLGGEIKLHHGKTTLIFSRDVSPTWVAQLIQAL